MDILSEYKNFKDFDASALKVPTVVEVEFDDQDILSEENNFLVFNITDKLFEPNFLKEKTVIVKKDMYVFYVDDAKSAQTKDPKLVNQRYKELQKLVDKDTKTFVDYPLPEDSVGEAKILISISDKNITSSMLTIIFADNVKLPDFVEVKADDKIVVAKTKMTSNVIKFPQTTAKRWLVSLTYSQPLRIAEIELNDDDPEKIKIKGLRFLAKPQKKYFIFFNPSTPMNVATGEMPDLFSDKGVFPVKRATLDNPLYKNNAPDYDKDGVPDKIDNCKYIPNKDQKDINSNGIGDACEDFDKDGIINIKDNCPEDPNAFQEDSDGDGIGDACDKEESRFTERNKWVPWAGMAFASVLLVVLFVATLRSMKKEKNE